MNDVAPLAARDGLERRYDGPIPPVDPAMRHASAPARTRLFERLAAEAVAQTARRRLLAATTAAEDRRLAVLSRSLHTYRTHGVAWR